MTLLGSYLQAELNRRDLSPEELAHRAGLGTSHIYQIMRGTKEPRQSTIAKIAAGLGMSHGELMMAVDSQASDDPFEREIRQKMAIMREITEGVPEPFRATIVAKMFDGAIDYARDMAAFLMDMPRTPVTSADEPGVTKPGVAGNRGNLASEDELLHGKQGVRVAQSRPRLGFVTPVLVASR